MGAPHDFWLSCGHHLLDRDEEGCLLVTDEFLKLYLARPELIPREEACTAERALHDKLLEDPRARVASAEISRMLDADARENWEVLLSWRDHLLRHSSLEAGYKAMVIEGLRFPSLFVDQIVQVILRNLLNNCSDPFVLRAAELFFRAQRLALHGGSLLAVDSESSAAAAQPTPLAALLGLQSAGEIEVLHEDNAGHYWERSDRFDFALDLTAARRGVAAVGEVVARWVRHLLRVAVKITPLTELRDEKLSWYVGLDATATRLGDALWRGERVEDSAGEFIVGLYRLSFLDDADAIDSMRGEPIYLMLAARDMLLRLKPQNLITGLPLRIRDEVIS